MKSCTLKSPPGSCFWWTVLRNVRNIPPNIALQTPPAVMLAAGVHATSPESPPTLCDPQTHQAPLSVGFSRQEYWSGLPCLPPGDLPDPGIEPASPALAGGSSPLAPGKPSVVLEDLIWRDAALLKHRQSHFTLPFLGSPTKLPLASVVFSVPPNKSTWVYSSFAWKHSSPRGGSLNLPHHQWLTHHLIQATLLRTATGGLPWRSGGEDCAPQCGGCSLDLRSGN